MRNRGVRVHLSLMFAILKKNTLEFIRSPAELLMSFMVPFVFMLPTYFLIRSFAPDGSSLGLASWVGNSDFVSFFMVGVIVAYITTTVFWGIGFSLKRLMDIGLLETIWVCPISKVVYLIGETLFSVLRMCYELVIVILLFRFVLRMATPVGLWAVLPFFIPFVFLIYGFGIAFASIVLLAKDANLLVDTTSFLVTTLTGAQNPPQVFPRYILAVSLAIPITYFIDILRVHTIAIEPLIPYNLEVAIFTVSSLIFPVFGILFFRFTDRRCRTLGNLQAH